MQAQYIQLSIETLLIVGVSLLVPAIAAIWALGQSLFFKPLKELKEAIEKVTEKIEILSNKQIQVELSTQNRINILEVVNKEVQTQLKDHVHKQKGATNGTKRNKRDSGVDNWT